MEKIDILHILNKKKIAFSKKIADNPSYYRLQDAKYYNMLQLTLHNPNERPL